MILIIIGFNLEDLLGFVELPMPSEFAQIFAQHIYDLFAQIFAQHNFKIFSLHSFGIKSNNFKLVKQFSFFLRINVSLKF